MLKKSIAFMLSLVLILSALPLTALATEPTAAPETTQATQPSETMQTTAASQPEGEQVAQEEEKKPEITASPVGAWGTVTPPQELRTKAARIQLLRNAIAWDYQNALVNEDAQSLKGYCGLLASYQLYLRGINTWRKSADGKDHFDEYSAMSMTTGGYIPQAYAAQEQTLEQPKEQDQAPEQDAAQDPAEQEAPKGISLLQTLNTITNHGTHDVYNLLVCFERTNTEAGAKYGHVVFIYGIIDGIMYFTEGGNMFGVEGGQVMECTISNFAAAYDTWAEFEGIIVLGCKDYLDNCVSYETDLLASVLQNVQLRSMPHQEEDSLLVRTAQKGERLHVIGLYENRDEQYYYQVDDGGVICYAQADMLLPLLYLHETFTLEEPVVPQTLQLGKDFSVDGNVLSPGALMSRVCVQILDEQGKQVQQYEEETTGEAYDLGNYRLNRELKLDTLEEGRYTFRVLADSTLSYVFGLKVACRVQPQTLLEQSFTVQADKPQEQAQTQEQTAVPAEAPAEPEPTQNGWYYENDTWYCYSDGAPCTGWIRSAGVTYYLREDGSVTTGWATIDDRQWLFTSTGALHTGWLRDQSGTKYFDADGKPVCGWQKIDGKYHYFNEDGFLQKAYSGATLRQLRQMGMKLSDIRAANEASNAENIPQEK